MPARFSMHARNHGCGSDHGHSADDSERAEPSGRLRLTLLSPHIWKSFPFRMANSDVPRIRAEFQVMFFDTDCAAVVHNIAYLRFIEVARTRLAEHLGLQLREMAEKQKYPVVLRTEIDYRRAARLGDHLVVEGWLDRIERVRFRCAFKILRPSDNMLIAECQQTLALIELPAARPLRLPQNWDRYRAAVTAGH